MSSSNDLPMSNHGGQNNMFHLHGMQHSGSQDPFANSIYSDNALADQWYYEDPEVSFEFSLKPKNIYWYRLSMANVLYFFSCSVN